MSGEKHKIIPTGTPFAIAIRQVVVEYSEVIVGDEKVRLIIEKINKKIMAEDNCE